MAVVCSVLPWTAGVEDESSVETGKRMDDRMYLASRNVNDLESLARYEALLSFTLHVYALSCARRERLCATRGRKGLRLECFLVTVCSK